MSLTSGQEKRELILKKILEGKVDRTTTIPQKIALELKEKLGQ